MATSSWLAKMFAANAASGYPSNIFVRDEGSRNWTQSCYDDDVVVDGMYYTLMNDNMT
jgi:hypothetical protein